LFRYYVYVCALPGKAVPEVTYTVSSETLIKPYSLTHSLTTRRSEWSLGVADLYLTERDWSPGPQCASLLVAAEVRIVQTLQSPVCHVY